MRMFGQPKYNMMQREFFYLVAGLIICWGMLGCGHDSEDRLHAEDILGLYTLSSRSVNTISDLTVPCCDTLELTTDADPDDLRGAMRAYGVGYENSGAFTLMPAEGLIEFEYGNTQRLRQYEHADGQLLLTYEEENQTIRESWRRLSQ